jgi:hypothetical protein
VCQPRLPQLGHRPQVNLDPFAFQRIPPRSQIDRSKPHDRQRTIQVRDSASIDVAQDRGASLVMSCWVRLTATRSPSSSDIDERTECSIVALGKFSVEPPRPREGSNHVRRRRWPRAARAQAKRSGRAKLDGLISRMRHSCRAGCSARAVKAKERSSGGCAPARCVDGAIWEKPVQDRHCPATVTPLGVAPAAKSDHPTRRVRRPSRERERTLHGALAAHGSP